jgi:glycosyltransferase involved in cell wall biosynthesis/SAM-dependent methyltransferase
MSGLRIASDNTSEISIELTPSADRHDRVADAYYGKLGDKFKRETRTRIHWVCEKVQGVNVLDVGCSQGIVPVLLAREGKIVKGLDLSPRAIDEAEQYLESEPNNVKKNISFVNAEFLTYDFGDKLYDTIILTEILEHITQPERFIALAEKLLPEDGQLVVTVPFGVNDFIDHKHTYYLLEPYKFIAKYFTIKEVTILGKWIGFVGIRSSCTQTTDFPAKLDCQLVSQLESSFLSVESRQQNEIESSRTRLNDANIKYRGSTQQVANLKQELAQKEASLLETRNAVSLAQVQLEEVRAHHLEEGERLQQEIVRLRKEGQSNGEAVQEAERQLIRREAELEALRSRLEDASFKYRASIEEIAKARERLAQKEDACKAAENDLVKTRTDLENMRGLLDHERRGFQQEIGRLTEDSDARKEAVHKAEKELIRRESELASVRALLDDAKLKCREMTEKSAAIHEQLAHQEVARKTAENDLEQTRADLQKIESRLEQERVGFQRELARLTEDGHARSQAVHKAEKELIRRQAEVEAMRARLDDADLKYRTSTEYIAAIKEQLAHQEVARKTAEAAFAQAHAELEAIQSRFEQERTGLEVRIACLTKDVNARRDAAREAEKALNRRELELEALRVHFRDLNYKYQASTKQVASVQVQLKLQEEARKIAETTLVRTEGELKEMRSRFEQEHSKVQRKIAQLNEDCQAKDEIAYKAESQILALTAEIENLRGQFNETNQNTRVVTARVDALKKTLSEEKAERLVTESTLKNSLEEANRKYRLVTGQEIPQLKHRLMIQEQRYKEKLNLVRMEAEYRVAKTRNTLSFRLGYVLLHCLKSLENFRRLAKDLWLLRREAVHRKQKSNNKEFLSHISWASKEIGTAQIERIENPTPRIANQITSVSAFVETPSLNSENGLKNLRVACIMDEFTFGSFAPECQLTQLTPTGWEKGLEASAPDLLLVESAWRGKDELWGNKVGHTSSELQRIVEWCRQRKIPTVFWNKEDPIHFETFLNTARLFDYVFTTDIDCIHRYKTALGHERVFLLPFACQPKIHNPIEKYERKDAFCFAGAYYVRYPERTRDLENFVEELPAFKPLEIYDRNYGKDDPNYTFPQSYQPYIVGTLPFAEIDKAYKGYRYAINLNSIKQSQSMFARRVYELLASNTITVSNFSRGVRLLFGDLVVTTDSGSEQVRRLKEWTEDDIRRRKLRLAALRKVMQEHTYGQRLAYVASKVSGKTVETSLPQIAVLAKATSDAEIKRIIENFSRQSYRHATLYLVVGKGASSTGQAGGDRVIYLKKKEAKKNIGEQVGNADLVAGMLSEDYYGPNYLLDVALATRYTDAQLIGKAAYFACVDGRAVLKQEDQAYRPALKLPARSAAIRTDLVANLEMLKWVDSLPEAGLEASSGLALDEFNYCRSAGQTYREELAKQVDDLAGLNIGIGVETLLERAERIAPEEALEDECATLSGKDLAENFAKEPSKAIQLRIEGERWHVASDLEDCKHEYLYGTKDHTPESLGFKEGIKLYLDLTPGLNIQLVVFFLDPQKQKISHVILHPNRNQEADIPLGTAWIRFGLRFYAGGSAEIKGLVLGHRNLQPAEMIGKAEHLVLTNHYPSYEDLYRNGFVHSRVRAYRDRGCRVDIFRLRGKEPVSYHEFEDFDVITGSQEALHKLLNGSRYKSVLVHFLNEAMWQVLQHHVGQVKVFVWVHGAEIQPWHRRDYNFENEEQRAAAKVQSEARMIFWRGLLREIPSNLKLIFVSKYFAEEVMEDLGFRLPEEHYTIIHNPIDTGLFAYQEKSPEQRKKILSIRPYASRKYANDLSVQAILALSKNSWFSDLEFRMIGDGKLFDETLEPLRSFDNVLIERRFLTHTEIATLHREYGMFLCPTRMDAQGVSKDEAMASGLIPITNNVTAIPEFVDEECGILADGEDADGMAAGIVSLYENPEKFLSMSRSAAERVRRQSGSQQIINRELSLFQSKVEATRVER